MMRALSAKQIVSDLQELAQETAFMYDYLSRGERERGEANTNMLKFFWDTYAHNQRRRWEKQRGSHLPFDPTKL